MKKRKICIICSVEFTYDKFLKSFVNNLVSSNYEVHVAFCFEQKRIISHPKIIFHNIPLKRKATIRQGISIIRDVRKFLIRYNFDLIHVHTPSAALYTRVANFLTFKKNKLIYVVHGFYFHENLNKYIYFIHFLLEYFLSKITDYIFFVSKEDYLLAKKFRFKKSLYLKHISNGVSDKRFFPYSKEKKNLMRKKYNIPSNVICIGIVARLVREKGFNELLNAFENLIKYYPNLHLLIAGSYLSSDYNDSAINQINFLKEKFPSKISLVGQINNIEEIYNLMDIFCLPSYREGLPYTLIEAMLCQLAIITTNIRGCRELIDHDQNGILVEIKKSYDLFHGIKKYLDNKKLASKFSIKARKKALKNFTEKNIIQSHIEIIAKIK